MLKRKRWLGASHETHPSSPPALSLSPHLTLSLSMHLPTNISVYVTLAPTKLCDYTAL